MTVIISKRWPNVEAIVGCMLLAATALAPAVPKAVGVALLLAWLFAITRTIYAQPARSIPTGWQLLWVIAVGCISVRLIMATAHGDGLQERHFELKWLLSLAAILALLRREPTALFAQYGLTFWVCTLGLFALSGFSAALLYSRGDLVTNAIPWANVMGFIAVALLIQAIYNQDIRLQAIAWVGSWLACLAIMASQTRGAYIAIFVVLAVSAWMVLHRCRGWVRGSLVAGATLGAMIVAPWANEAIHDRWMMAIQEWQAIKTQQPGAADTSIGARVVLWERSWEVAQEIGWQGVGIPKRREFIRTWADEHQSATLRSLGHVHQEYLNAWLDHGLAGLLTSLMLPLSALLLGFYEYQKYPDIKWTLIGWGLIAGLGGLTNVNTAHNYYTSAWCLLWLLLVMLRIPHNPAVPQADSKQ